MFESEGSSLSWPPTAKYLRDLNFSLAEKLDQFLTSLLTEKKIQVTTPKTARLVNSIGKDICRAWTLEIAQAYSLVHGTSSLVSKC
jgi:hypothetical protein